MVSVWAGEHPRAAAGHKSASQKDICFAKWCVESGAVPIARATSTVQADPSLVLLFCPFTTHLSINRQFENIRFKRISHSQSVLAVNSPQSCSEGTERKARSLSAKVVGEMFPSWAWKNGQVLEVKRKGLSAKCTWEEVTIVEWVWEIVNLRLAEA